MCGDRWNTKNSTPQKKWHAIWRMPDLLVRLVYVPWQARQTIEHSMAWFESLSVPRTSAIGVVLCCYMHGNSFVSYRDGFVYVHSPNTAQYTIYPLYMPNMCCLINAKHEGSLP